MLSKNYLKKINYIFSAVSLVLLLFGYFALNYNNTAVANFPTITITLLNPVYSVIETLTGNNDFYNLLCSILTINLCYYAVVVLPFALFNWVRGLFNRD